MRGGQRERTTAGLARQREPVQAEMTSQRGEVISPARQAALRLVIGAAVPGLSGEIQCRPTARAVLS